jgi:hypothetical protein
MSLLPILRISRLNSKNYENLPQAARDLISALENTLRHTLKQSYAALASVRPLDCR